MSAYSGLIKVLKKGAPAPAKAAPFYSAVDEVAQGLSRNKGTGKEFLREIEKTKGVKPAEIKDRKLDKILNTDQKMTKDDLVKVLEDNPPKQITEDIMGDNITPDMINQQIDDMIQREVMDELGPRPRYGYESEDWLEDYDRLIEQKDRYRDDYYEAAKNSIREDGGFYIDKYSEYKLPGGKNYREILLKLPTFDPAKERQLMQLEAYQRRGATDKAMDEKLNQLRAEKESFGGEYQSKHWDQPNVLAHMRVQDRVGPNGEKVLHVEEIQSDWHQAGRDKGYRSADQQDRMAATAKPMDGYFEVSDQNGNFIANVMNHDLPDPTAQSALAEAQRRIQAPQIGRQADDGRVPDAPFKKNWHELAMKRLINYASENGYDKIAITPGAEQAKRYDLSKQISGISWNKRSDGLYNIEADTLRGEPIVKKNLTEQELEDTVGKEVASKIVGGVGQFEKDPLFDSGKLTRGRLENLDLKVGGEGMMGFYDQMLPAYLNKFGEKYGAKVGSMDIGNPSATNPNNLTLPGYEAKSVPTAQLHSFDITPSMREEVLTKGQPLYQQIGIPAATGAAGAEMLGAEMSPETSEEPGFAEGGAVNENTVPDMSDGGQILQGAPFKRGGKVSITNNPDAMFLELNDKKFRRK
jgi:hypothetical protein